MHDYKIHDMIGYVHEMIRDALSIVQTEESNQSLHGHFKQMNDHALNAFNYGRSFMTYLLFANPKAGADLLSSSKALDQNSYETGKLLSLLNGATTSVMRLMDRSQTPAITNGGTATEFRFTVERAAPQRGSQSYLVNISGLRAGSPCEWQVKRSTQEFERLHSSVGGELAAMVPSLSLQSSEGAADFLLVNPTRCHAFKAACSRLPISAENLYTQTLDVTESSKRDGKVPRSATAGGSDRRAQ